MTALYSNLLFAITSEISYNTPMRIMGIDYGTKRVGVAFTDESGTMSFPHGVIPNSPKLLDVLTGLITEKTVQMIVIGQSLDRNGQPNAIQSAIDNLVLDITLATGLPVHLVPEQYSTQAAIQLQGRNEATDASAAALILDSYLLMKQNK